MTHTDTVPVIAFARETAEAAPRLCKDCRWADFHLPRFAECNAPQNIVSTVSLVTGELVTERRFQYCESQRAAGPHGDGKVAEANCSTSGRWFEPREIQAAAE
jgi:hypothetical protein